MDMFSDEFGIIHIPGRQPNLPGQQPTVDVFASFIEPKLANCIIRKLNKVAPLENLRHVKRVRKTCLDVGKAQLSVILCIAGDIPKDVLELINTYQLSTFISQVCKYAPTSREEWEEQCKLWPTSFHPPTYNIEGITGFSEEGSKTILSYMQHVIKLATAGKEVVNAAVIVDPSINQVISTACDDICSWHISPTENGTAKYSSDLEQSEFLASGPPGSGCSSDKLQSHCLGHDSTHYTSVQCLCPWQWSKHSLFSGKASYWHPLRHAAMVAIENSAARDRRLFPATDPIAADSIQVDPLATCSPAKKMRLASNVELQKVVISQGLSSASLEPGVSSATTSLSFERRGEDSDAVKSDSLRPYLCTGFDIFLAWEPCVMCAMALVHQRIRRIFYAFLNPQTGALGSIHRLQGEKSLNHHYAVFRVQLPRTA